MDSFCERVRDPFWRFLKHSRVIQNPARGAVCVVFPPQLPRECPDLLCSLIVGTSLEVSKLPVKGLLHVPLAAIPSLALGRLNIKHLGATRRDGSRQCTGTVF